MELPIELYLEPSYFTLWPYLYPTGITVIGLYLIKNIIGYLSTVPTKLSLKFFGGISMLTLCSCVVMLNIAEIYHIGMTQRFKNQVYMCIRPEGIVHCYDKNSTLPWNTIESIKALGDPKNPTGIRVYMKDGSFVTYDKKFSLPMAEVLESMLQVQKNHNQID